MTDSHKYLINIHRAKGDLKFSLLELNERERGRGKWLTVKKSISFHFVVYTIGS